MKRWTSEDLIGKPCAQLNGALLDLQPLVHKGFDQPAHALIQSEGALQKKCERYLENQHFKRLTAAHAAQPARGWFGHLHKPEGNPFLPDLIIFHEPNDRPALLVELKVSLKFQPGQKEMIDRDAWKLCMSFAEFVHAFHAWKGTKEPA